MSGETVWYFINWDIGRKYLALRENRIEFKLNAEIGVKREELVT